MGGHDWKRIKSLLGEALDRPVADRPAFLDEVCGSDLNLRAEIERLLGGAM